MTQQTEYKNFLPVLPLDEVHPQRKYWFLTLFEEEFTPKNAKNKLHRRFTTLLTYKYIIQAIAQMEACPTTGTLHIHFAVTLDLPTRTPVKKFQDKLPDLLDTGIHAVENCKGSKGKNKFMELVYIYTAKAQTRIAGPLYFGFNSNDRQDQLAVHYEDSQAAVIYQDKWVPKPLSDSTKEYSVQRAEQKAELKALDDRATRSIKENEKEIRKRVKELKDIQVKYTPEVLLLTQKVAYFKPIYTKAAQDAWANNPVNPAVPLTRVFTQYEIDMYEYEKDLAHYNYIKAEIDLYCNKWSLRKVESELEFWENTPPSKILPIPPTVPLECPFTLPPLPLCPRIEDADFPVPPPKHKESKTLSPEELYAEFVSKTFNPRHKLDDLKREYTKKLAQFLSKHPSFDISSISFIRQKFGQTSPTSESKHDS